MIFKHKLSSQNLITVLNEKPDGPKITVIHPEAVVEVVYMSTCCRWTWSVLEAFCNSLTSYQI